MITTHHYLNFAGNTEEAFKFYHSVFGGTLSQIYRFADTPEASKMSAEDAQKVMHVALTLDKGTMLMGTDVIESFGQKLIVGNNTSIYVDTESEAAADELFNKLSAGGNVSMPMAKVFWGAYYGAFTDKYGIQWMINFTYKEAK
jgi:PhnB protein